MQTLWIKVQNQRKTEGIVPKLNQKDFYNQIVIKSGKPYITDQFIVNVITDVDLSFNIQKINQKEININFK